MTATTRPRGHVRVVVTGGQGPAASRLRELLSGLELTGLDVTVQPTATGWGPAEVERLTSGPVDYLVFVAAELAEPDRSPEPEGLGDQGLPGRVRDAIELLRSDLTTAAVGGSATGAPRGDLEAAVSGDLLAVRAEAFREAGGFAPEAGGVLDDLDLCLRLWLRGHRVRSAGGDRVPLRGERADTAVVRTSLLLALATLLEDDDLAAPAWHEPEAARALGVTGGRRRRHGAHRRRGSGELVPMLHRWAAGWVAAGGPADVTAVLGRWGAPERAGTRRRIAVLTADVLAPAMAGPAIRATAIARTLAVEHDVRLFTTERCDLSLPGIEVRHADGDALRAGVAWADVVVFQGWLMRGREWLRDGDKVVVVDVYDPMHLEQLEQGREAEGERGRVHAVREATATLNEQLLRADRLLCASSKQRDLWLGALASLGRVNPVTYDEDQSLEQLIALAPFGVVEEPFDPGPGALRDVVPGIGPEDKIVLWGGGVYNWFDPLTLVRAVDRLRARIPDLRLYFLGMGHPNPAVPAMRMAAELRSLATDLGLVGTHVFFNEGWVPFDERAGYLRDADVGVSTHLDHVESEFSFRTRILDYLWAGLPVVATGGDVFAELLERHGAGRTVPPGDVDALVDALAAVLLDPEVAERCRAGSAALAAELTWDRTLEPLIRFCRSARRAPDIACPTFDSRPDAPVPGRGLRRDLQVAAGYLRSGDAAELRARLAGRVRRLRRGSRS